MKTTIYRRIRRRSTHDVTQAGKERGPEQPFFGAAPKSGFFEPVPTLQRQPEAKEVTSVQPEEEDTLPGSLLATHATGIQVSYPILMGIAHVDSGISNSERYDFINTSDQTITIDELIITGSPYFTIKLIGNNVIGPGEASPFVVVFTPGQAGLSEGVIHLVTQDNDTYAFPVSGKGEIVLYGPGASPASKEKAKGEAPEPVVPDKAPSRKNLKAYGDYLEKRVEHVSYNANRYYGLATGAITKGIKNVDNTIVELNKICNVYERVYKDVKSVIERGKGSIKEAEFFSDLVLGLAVGVAAGLTMGAVFPVVESAAFATRAVSKLVSEVSTEMVEAAVSKGIDALGSSSGGGTQEFLDKANPLLKHLQVYQNASDSYRELAKLVTELKVIQELDHACGSVGKDCREFAAAGKHNTLSIDQLEARVRKLEEAEQKASEVVVFVQNATGKLETAYNEAKEAANKVNTKNIEFHLWLQWMSQLEGDDRNLIDADPQDRLESLGIMSDRAIDSKIGWGVGSWVSKENQDEGVDLARLHIMALSMIGMKAKITGGGILYSIEFEGVPWYKKLWNLICAADSNIAIGEEMMITDVKAGGLLDGKPILIGEPVNKNYKTQFYQ